ncbi:MAG: glycosyltransferase [Sedimenticolaceae bacterium]
MDIGLCMVVKDEAHQLAECLDPVLDLFDQVAITDTGSRDGTPELLLSRFGIRVLHKDLESERCHCLCDARYAALDRLSTPWVCLLDADERIDREGLLQIRAMADDDRAAGYFGHWINHTRGEPAFEDYKLFVYRRGLRPIGLVHDVAQLDIRARGLQAYWLDALRVDHFPDPKQGPTKVARYRRRLLCAMRQQPDCLRYHWFLGYTEFRAGDLERAAALLSVAAEACSTAYPVECLNSAMVLAEIQAGQGDAAAVKATLSRARAFHQQVANDFEVRINLRLGPWLDEAWGHYRQRRWDRIRAYRFAC